MASEQSTIDRQIGQRLRAAAVQAGITGAEIARRLGVRATTVHRWWYGDRAPSRERMVAYAALVGKPVEYFYRQGAPADDHPRELSDFLLQWSKRLMAGEEPGAAFDRVTGDPREL